jgi:RHS repeat-associated protein
MYTLYDELNRPKESGLWNNNLAAADHRTAAYGSTNYPSLSGTWEILTQTFYGDYSWLAANGNPFNNAYSSAYDSYFQTPTNIFPYPQANVQSFQIKGMVAGNKVKVLGTSTYLYTIIFYDEKGRVIQSQSKNITGGTDILTTQYSWSGQPLVTIQKHEKVGANAQTTVLVTQTSYDDLGRVIKTEKKQNSTLVNGGAMSAYTTISTVEYDKLGQLKKKTIGSKKDIANNYITPRQPIEELTYDYNIRGWMLGMNRNYLATTGQSGTTKFGFELGYDKTTNQSGRNYQGNGLFNGNITGMVWKSDGDDVKRKYDFIYDAANRILKGVFEQDDANASWNSTTMKYDMLMGDGADATTAYDANGNIKAMTQYGWKIGAPVGMIDNLTYSYFSNSNRLQAVTDVVTTDNKLGDFTDKNTTATDYGYDKNGNMVTDLNKRMNGATGSELTSGGAITYNHLNLPAIIIVKKDDGTDKGTITYTYDATGNKLKKEVNETGQPLKTTLYVGGAVYENDVLQFLGHEEGRIRFKPASGSVPASLQYDYMIKDHLGNVRMVLTEEQQQDVYPAATLESVTYNGGTAISVEDDYYSVTAANVVNQSDATNIPTYQNNNGNPPYNNNPYSNNTANSAKLYKLNATTNSNPNKTGLGIVLKVMAGDNINIFGKSYHKMPGGSGYSGTTNSIIVTELINAFAGTGLVSSKGVAGADITGQSGFPSTINELIGNQPNQTSSTPKASINWVLFDEQFKYVTGGFDMVGTAVNTNGTFKNHSILGLPVTKNGYIYVYVSNESQYNVFFDNLQLIHNRGPVVEETHYYPFGLTMTGISSKALSFGGVENKYKFNDGTELANKEFSDGSGLDLYETPFRSYDAQIGRFHQIDAMADDYESWSSYSFAFNNPILFNDPSGLAPKDSVVNGEHVQGNVTHENVTVTTSKKNSWKMSDWGSWVDLHSKHYTYQQCYDRLVKDGVNDHGTDLFYQAWQGIGYRKRVAEWEENFANFVEGLLKEGATWVAGGAALKLGGKLVSLGYRAYKLRNGTTIYRIVSSGEKADVLLMNGFRQAPISSRISSYEGKLFWTNIKDAKWFNNFAGEGNHILKINVNKSFIFENGTDAGRLFNFVSPERLQQFNSAINLIK